MVNPLDGRPFSKRLSEIRSQRRHRYADLEREAGRVRSSAWFNNLLNGSAWSVSPPPRDTWEAMARLLETTVPHVREMVAEEWYQVTQAEQSERVATLAPRLDELTDEDVALVEKVIQRLLVGSRDDERGPAA